VKGVSTRRRWPGGKVHEMATLGVKTLCGREMPEPWDWTDDEVDCRNCLAAEWTLRMKGWP
jgi:hypothetical protein